MIDFFNRVTVGWFSTWFVSLCRCCSLTHVNKPAPRKTRLSLCCPSHRDNRIYFPNDSCRKQLPCYGGQVPVMGGRTQPLFSPVHTTFIYLHPLPALGRRPLVSQLRQRSGHTLVHGRTGGLAGEHGARRLQLLHPRLGQPLVAPHGDEGVRLGRRPRHPPASREAVGGGRGRRPACRPRAHVQRREAVRR